MVLAPEENPSVSAAAAARFGCFLERFFLFFFLALPLPSCGGVVGSDDTCGGCSLSAIGGGAGGGGRSWGREERCEGFSFRWALANRRPVWFQPPLGPACIDQDDP